MQSRTAGGDGSDPAEFIPDLVLPIVAGQALFVLGSRMLGLGANALTELRPGYCGI